MTKTLSIIRALCELVQRSAFVSDASNYRNVLTLYPITRHAMWAETAATYLCVVGVTPKKL
jgi:hypothetical protein